MKKKLAILIFISFFGSGLYAQTLTKSANEPFIGDVVTQEFFDSVTTIPRMLGTNQTWDFSTLIESQLAVISTSYALASTVPSSSLFPGAMLAEIRGNGEYNFYRSVSTPTTQFELLGSASVFQPSSSITYTDPLISFLWPVSYGSFFSDYFAGTGSGRASGPTEGNRMVIGSGTGTLILPGGISFSDVLQVNIVSDITENFYDAPSTPFTFSLTQTEYIYYHRSQKFPLLKVIDQIYTDWFSSDTSTTIIMNRLEKVGLKESVIDNIEVTLFPNPVQKILNIDLKNSTSFCNIKIYDQMGRVVLSENQTRNPDLSNLKSGIYFVEIISENNVERKKIIKE